MMDLKEVRERITWSEARLANQERLAEKERQELAGLREQEANLTPPFQVGDTVQPSDWTGAAHWKVLGNARVAGEWVTLVDEGGFNEVYLSNTLALEPKPTFPYVGARFHSDSTGRNGVIKELGERVVVRFDDIEHDEMYELDWLNAHWTEVA